MCIARFSDNRMNYDFLRIPMLPQTAQKIADLYGAILPTRKFLI